MGRALFSQKYSSAAPAVSVKTEPEVVTYTTWSRWNPFDPDSNEFFVDAEREVFTDTPEYQRELEEIQQRDAANPVTVNVVEPPSFERSNSAPVQPITSSDWQDRFLTAGASSTQWEHLSGTRTIVEPDGSERVIPVYISSGYRSPTTTGFTPEPISDTYRSYDVPPRSIIVQSIPTTRPAVIDATPEVEPSSSPSPPSPTFRRMVDIEVPSPPSPQSSATPDSPSTPTDESFEEMMFSPSPPPSVSPRIYNWNHRPTPAASPSYRPNRSYRESVGGRGPRLHLATAAATRGRPYVMVAGRV